MALGQVARQSFENFRQGPEIAAVAVEIGLVVVVVAVVAMVVGRDRAGADVRRGAKRQGEEMAAIDFSLSDHLSHSTPVRRPGCGPRARLVLSESRDVPYLFVLARILIRKLVFIPTFAGPGFFGNTL